MTNKPLNSLTLVVAGAANELGCETTRQLVARGHRVIGLIEKEQDAEKVRSSGGTPDTVVFSDVATLTDSLRRHAPSAILNLIPQAANTTLSDGHAWKGLDWQLPATTAALSTAAEKAQIGYMIQTSYAFLYGAAQNATESTPLNVPNKDPIFKAAINADEAAQRATLPTCVLRLGYLYGPQSHDLLAYWKAFKWHRGYYAGQPDLLQNFLHFDDAARALVAVAEGGVQGHADVYNVVDGSPVWFGKFMDDFAQQLGFGKALHIPPFAAPFIQFLIARPHSELLEFSTTVNSDKFRHAFNWSPLYPTYTEGLTETIATWRKNGTTP